MAKAPNNPFEKIENPEQEAQDIKETVALTETLLEKRYPKGKKVLRGVHPRSHGCLKAVFEVRHDVPEKLRVGLFAKPGKRYDAWVRFSNAAIHERKPDVDPDAPESQRHGSRGMAVKVVGVEGRVLLEDNGEKSQDFLMINTPSFAFIDASQYLTLNRALDTRNDDEGAALADTVLQHLQPDSPSPPAVKARALKSAQVVGQIAATPVANPCEVSYFGAAPFLFGPDHVMRFKVEPWGGDQLPQVLPKAPANRYLRQAVRRTTNRREDICFDFKIQVRGKGEKNLKIEDATAHWENTPFTAVARIIIPAPADRPGPNREASRSKREARCERMAFTPWHCLAAHQPLGSINRLRKGVYLASAEKRGASKPRRPRRAAKAK